MLNLIRYCNMDYIVASTLKILGIIPRLVISYEIVCQWALRFLERILLFPPHVRPELPSGPGELQYAIPKYHFQALVNARGIVTLQGSTCGSCDGSGNG